MRGEPESVPGLGCGTCRGIRSTCGIRRGAVQLGQELAERGITASSYPQTDVRTIPASARLRDAIVRQQVVLPDDHELRRHAANAIARQKTRGWKIEAPDRSSNVDAIVPMMMALDRLENRPEPVKLLGCL